ncbi:MAG TPA: hypothetical protein V6C71_01845 [Coleofasciculaceae cyanobacterium]
MPTREMAVVKYLFIFSDGFLLSNIYGEIAIVLFFIVFSLSGDRY